MANLDDALFFEALPRSAEVTETVLPTGTWTLVELPAALTGNVDRYWLRVSLSSAFQVRIGAAPSSGLAVPANTVVELGPYAQGTVLQVRQSSGGPLTLSALVEWPAR